MADVAITTADRVLLHAEGTFVDSSTGVPPGPLTWVSSDPSVAVPSFVDDSAGNCWVNGESVGTATITVTSGAVSGSFEVQVDPASPVVDPGTVLASIAISVIATAAK